MHLNLIRASKGETMKVYKTILIIISIILASNVYSFEGYEKYPMLGNSIFPLIDVSVKLLEIKVLMERKESDVATKVTTEYILENLSNKEVTFKVAFPVESNCVGCTKMPDDFKVLVDGKPIQTFTSKIIERDFLFRISKEISLKDARREIVYPPTRIKDRKDEIILITWEISFKPKEKKLVDCTYTLDWSGDPGVEYFEHNLSALYLWKGNIEKAYFRLILPHELIDEIKDRRPSKWPKIEIHPQQYKIKGNAIEWFFKNLKQRKIGYVSVKIDYHKPGVLGD
jgi:hypothetical protein